MRGLIVAMAVAVALSGCGRTAMEVSCSDDEDCGEDERCASGSCVSDESNMGSGEESDLCESDLDCGDGQCREGDEGCIGDVCDLESGQCLEGACEPDCAEDEEQQGCACVPPQCSSNVDCFVHICDGGSCRPCLSDAECTLEGATACRDGMCSAAAECVDDGDCPPSQQCGDDQRCEERPECTFDDDCAEDESCIAGSCTFTPACSDDDDCSELAECVGGQCQTRMCRGSDDCDEGEICDAGDCVDPPVVLTCEVVTSSQSVVANESVNLQAFAYDQWGNAVSADFQWSSSNPASVEIDGSSAVGTSEPGSAEVTAVPTGGDPVACQGSATIENLGLSTPDELRVRVQHMETGDPIDAAEVHVGDQVGVSDINGVVDLTMPDDAYDISVFHDDYNFLSILDVTAGDIVIPLLPQSGAGPVAGFTGEFNTSAITTSGDIELGLAGASLAGDLLDVNLERLLGDSFVTDIDVPVMGEVEVPLPGGVTASGSFLGTAIDGKDRYYAQSAEGPRLAWGIAGEIPLGALLGVVSDPPEDIGSAIGQFLPLFSRFDHGQQSKVFEALPRVQDTQDINNNGNTQEWLPDYDSFPEQNLLPSVRQQLTTEVAISSLPQIGGEQAEVAVLLGGVLVEDIGLVPLGISAVYDEDGDGQPGSETLYMAPPYGPAAGERYVVLALSFGVGPGGLAEEISVSMWNGQQLGTTTSLGTFPDGSTGGVDEGQRTVEIDEATAGPIFRVRHVGFERSWDVWAQGPEGVSGEFGHDVMVPDVPAPWPDLFEMGGRITVDAIRSSVELDDLVSSSGVGLHRAGLVTTNFNRSIFR